MHTILLARTNIALCIGIYKIIVIIIIVSNEYSSAHRVRVGGRWWGRRGCAETLEI